MSVSAMHDRATRSSAMRTSAMRTSWSDENARGLTYAAVGAWSDAADAFASALDVAGAQSDIPSHEALALILGNLAQACFRAGRTDEGIRHGQRACSLRAALVGDDAIAVARARADLAVMLGSVGRAAEGLGLMTRAIAGIERSAGDEDLRLSSVLENAARLAMAAGEPSTAEPYLIRLHALLAAHELPTDAADLLLSRVASYRRRDQQVFSDRYTQVDEPTSMIVDSVPLETMRVTAHATPADVVAVVGAPVTLDVQGPDDDQPLRDAVRVTDRLLRTTPRGSRAITPGMMMAIEDAIAPVRVALEIEPSMSARVVGLEFDLVDQDVVEFADASADTSADAASDAAAVRQTEGSVALAVAERDGDESSELSEVDDIFGSVTFDLVDADASSDHSAPIDGSQADTRPSNGSHNDILGFEVEYGTVSGPIEPDQAGMIVLAPAVSTHIPTPTAATKAAASTAISRATPRGTPVVMPSPATSHRAVGLTSAIAQALDATGEQAREERAPRLTLQHADEHDAGHQIRRPNIRAGRASAPRSSRGLMVAGVVTTVIAVSVGWFIRSGGF